MVALPLNERVDEAVAVGECIDTIIFPTINVMPSAAGSGASKVSLVSVLH